MNTSRKWSLQVPGELWLDMANLTARIRVIGGGEKGVALVTAEGDGCLLKRHRQHRHPRSHRPAREAHE